MIRAAYQGDNRYNIYDFGEDIQYKKQDKKQGTAALLHELPFAAQCVTRIYCVSTLNWFYKYRIGIEPLI